MSTAKSLASLSPTFRFRSPTGDKPYPLHRGNFLLSYISPSTCGNQRRARSHYHFHAIIRQLASVGYDTLFGLISVKVFRRDTLEVAFVGELDGNLYTVDFSKES